MAYSTIYISKKPEEVYVCKPELFEATATLVEVPRRWPNFAVGLMYVEGPTDTLIVRHYTGTYEVGKGEILILGTYGTLPKVARTENVTIHFTEAGTHTIRFVSGYVYLGTFHIDNYEELKVEVKKREEEVPPPPPPTPKPVIGPREVATITTSLIALGASLLGLPADKRWLSAPITVGTALATYFIYPKLEELKF